jgi:hypothetical protein
MKTMTFSLIVVLLFTATSVISQWSTDPQNPGLVCDLTGIQNNVSSFSDEAGGAYVFWLDARNNPGDPAKEIYGQHYDSEGYAMWEPDGRLIATHYHRIMAFEITPGIDGNMVLGMITKSVEAGSGDTLRFHMMDASGEHVWDNELVVGNTGSVPHSIIYITNFMVLPVEDEYYVFIGVTYSGGANGNRYTRFDSGGDLLGVYDGVPVGSQGYVGPTRCATTYDGSNDFYLFYATGNGSGADLHAFRFNSGGSLIWGPVDVTEGTSGLSYQMDGVSDPNGISFVWQGNSGGSVNLMSRRLSPSGSFLWGGEVLNVCAADGSQTNFHLKRKDMYIFITWADGRPGTDPGNYDIYAQKMDTTGFFYWTPDGNQVASFNTYIPHPMLEILDDYSIFVNHQSTQAGFMAQWSLPPTARCHGDRKQGRSALQLSIRSTSCTIFFNRMQARLPCGTKLPAAEDLMGFYFKDRSPHRSWRPGN